MTPTTNRAVAVAQSLSSLAVQAEQDPIVKKDLQAQFDSYSHNPVIMALASMAGMALAQQHITVDNTLLTVAIGLVVTGVGYGYQWLSMRFRKPVTT